MPLPKPNENESKEDFLDRCMANPTMNNEYPNRDQRYAVCNSQWKRRKKDFETEDAKMPTIPFKSYPKAPEDTAWSFSSEDGNKLIESGGCKAFAMVHALMKSGGSYIDEEKFKKSDFNLPHHKYVGGSIKTVLRGVIAASGALQGARGGVQGYSSEDKNGAKNHLNKHFGEFNRDDLKKAFQATLLGTYMSKDIVLREFCAKQLKKLEFDEPVEIELSE
jgi:hypothetical protein